MSRYILLFILCWSARASCQSRCDCFDRLYQLANNQSNEQKFIEIMEDALTFLDTPQQGEYYWQIAQSYGKMKNFDSSAAWYFKALEWGYDLESLKWYSPEVYRRMDPGRIDALVSMHSKKINIHLYNAFVAQHALDQGIRNEVLFPADSSAPDCTRSVLDSSLVRIDDSTFRLLKKVFDNYGYPTYHRLGFYPLGLGVMILHVTARKNENATHILTKLGDLNSNCDYLKSSILLLIDRQKYINETKTHCGLFGSGERYLNIADISKADSIRFIFNRLRLKEEAAGWNGKLPENYKPRPYPKNYFCLKKYELE